MSADVIVPGLFRIETEVGDIVSIEVTAPGYAR